MTDLFNGGFESGLVGWTPYHLYDPAELNIESRLTGATLIHGGNQSLRFVQKWNRLHSGVYQTVTVVPGTVWRLSAWGYLLYGDTPAQNQIAKISSELRVGIDAAGGTDPRAATVKWAGVGGNTDWVQATVQDAAEGAALTVFVDGRIGLDWPPDMAVVVLDDITLERVGTPDPPPAERPTRAWKISITGMIEEY